MKYTFKRVDAGRGSQTAIVLFKDKKYEILTEFFGSDVYPHYKVLTKLFSKVLSNESIEESFIGNQCGLKIRKDKTKVFDTLDEDIHESLLEVNTMELSNIIQAFMQYVKDNHLYYE